MLEPVELRCDVTIEMNVFARGIAALFAILALVVLGGCESTRGGSIPYERADFGVPDAPSKSVPLNVDYRIAPLDTLAITVYQEEDLTKEVQVDLRGSIGMPMVGSMRAVDLTTAQLEEQLETQYRRFIKNPDVSVAIKSSTRSNVTVDGSVQSPGVFPVTGPTTLIQAIAMAKGTTEAANPAVPIGGATRDASGPYPEASPRPGRVRTSARQSPSWRRWGGRRSAPAARLTCGARSAPSKARCWPIGIRPAISSTG